MLAEFSGRVSELLVQLEPMATKSQGKVRFMGGTEIHRFQLVNGLRLFVLERRNAPVFSYQTWFDVGSRDEEPGKSGLAHLFEHMMFKGTKKMPQGTFDRAMESAGARDLNAFTSTDYTAYVASLPVEFLDLAAELESDRMVGLTLTKEQFESERDVVHNERKQRLENNPEGKMFEELQKLAFHKHPYGRPIIGYAEDLNRMTTLDCEEFYRSHYAPNNAVICVVGDVRAARVLKIIDRHYGPIPTAYPRRARVQEEPRQGEERVSVLTLPLQVEKTYMGFRVPPANHSDHAALSVLSAVMSSGRSSLLYRAMVDSGVTMDASINFGGAKDPSLGYATFTCQSGHSAERAIDAFDKSLRRFLDEGPEAEELERAKNKLRTEIHMGMSTNSSLAHFIGQNELVMGEVSAAVDELERMGRIGRAEVMSAAERYLSKLNRSVVIGKPA